MAERSRRIASSLGTAPIVALLVATAAVGCNRSGMPARGSITVPEEVEAAMFGQPQESGPRANAARGTQEVRTTREMRP
jgi:hypothetical protein